MPYGPPPQPRSSKESRKEESRAKRVRITVDLTQADYQVLNRWLAGASVKLDQPLSRMTLARGIRAMIQATAADQAANDAVLDVLRTEQSLKTLASAPFPELPCSESEQSSDPSWATLSP